MIVERSAQRHAGALPGDHRRSPAHRRRIVGQGGAQIGVGQHTQSQRRPERQFSRHRVRVGRAPHARQRRHRCSPATAISRHRRRHFLSMCDSVMTIHEAPKPINVAAMTPVTIAIVLPATSAQILRHHCVRRCSETSASTTGRPTRARLGRRARAGFAVALAGLRQPAATSATMARTAIQAVAMVSSLVDTQESIVIEPRAEVRSPSRRHLFWAIPLAVIGFVARRRRRGDRRAAEHARRQANATARRATKHGVCTKQGASEKVQFAVVPADAQPVEPRLSIEGPTDVRQRRPGAVRDRAATRAEHAASGGSGATTRRSPSGATTICTRPRRRSSRHRAADATCARRRRRRSTSRSIGSASMPS